MPLPDIPSDDYNTWQAQQFQNTVQPRINAIGQPQDPQIEVIRQSVDPEYRHYVDNAVAAANKYGIDPLIYVKQIRQESGFNPKAGSNEGAHGIAQFLDSTAKGFGIDAWNPDQALDAGAHYMRQNLDANKGDYRLALASYNAGQGNVNTYGQKIFDPQYLLSQGWKSQDAYQPKTYIDSILGTGANAVPASSGSPSFPAQTPPAAATGFPPLSAVANAVRPLTDAVQEIPFEQYAQNLMSKLGAGPTPSGGPPQRQQSATPSDLSATPDQQDFGSYATGKIASLGYNDMAGVDTNPTPAFGANPPGVTSPIDQARDSQAATQPTPYNDMAGASSSPVTTEPSFGEQALKTIGDISSVPAQLTRSALVGPSEPQGPILDALGQATGPTGQGVINQARNVYRGVQQSDPSAPFFPRVEQVLRNASQPFEQTVTDTQAAIRPYDPTGGLATGAVGLGAHLASDPLMYVAPVSKAMTVGTVGGALAGYGVSRYQGASPEQTAANVETGGNLGMLAGGAGEGLYHVGKAVAPYVPGAVDAAGRGLTRLGEIGTEHGLVPGLGIRDTSPVPTVGANGEVVPGIPQTRMFHGTAASYGRPDPDNFQGSGLYGPGYYLTSEPRVAESYSKISQFTSTAYNSLPLNARRLQSEIADLKNLIKNSAYQYPRGQIDIWRNETIPKLQAQLDEALSHGPNVRAINVPNDMRLFDVRDSVSPETVDQLTQGMTPRTVSSFLGSLGDFKGATNQSVYDALTEAGRGNKEWANNQLQKLGYDGIAHTGGLLTPIKDAAGNPISHEVNVIFPESMVKLTNAISGTRFGSSPTVGGALVGGYAGSQQGDTPEDRARNALKGAALGAAGGYAATHPGQLAQAVKQLGAFGTQHGLVPGLGIKAVDEIIAPARNATPEVRTALKNFANRNLQGEVDAETMGLTAKKVLGADDNLDAAHMFEMTGQTVMNPTPEQALHAQVIKQYMDNTQLQGVQHGYINGNVTTGPNSVAAYFPHIYQENLTRATTMARKSGLNPNDFYSNARVHRTLADAQAAGLNPVDSFSGPLQHYAGRIASSEAKYQLVDDLKSASPVSAIPYTAGQRLPDGWVPGMSTVPQFAGYAFPEGVARAIQNIVSPSGVRRYGLGSAFLNAQGEAKGLLFSLSGFHNVTELRQAINANGIKSVPILADTLKHAVSPGAYDAFRLSEARGFSAAARAGVTGLAGDTKALDVGGKMNPKLATAFRSGAGAVSGAASGYGIGAASGADDQTKLKLAIVGALGGAAAGPLMKPIADSLWERQVPTLKYLTWKTQVAAGRNPEAAAAFVNNTYGGQNLAAIARSKTVQDLVRTVALAPDWWESWANQLGDVAKRGDKGAMARQYWARTAVINAFTLEGLNYAFNHHFTNQNDPDHANQLEMTGVYKMLGVDRRDPKTGAPTREYMAILPGPIESLMNLATGGTEGAVKFAKGRASTGVRVAVGQFANKDYRGQTIVPPYTPPLEAAKLRAADALGQISPIGVQQAETSSANAEPASLAAFSVASGLRTSQASKATYAGPQLSQKSYDILQQSGIGDWQPSPIGDAIDGFGLTRDERTRYQQLVDQQREAVLEKLGQRQAWRNLSAPEKKQILDDVMRSADQAVAAQILRGIPRDELKHRYQVATAAKR